MGMTPKRSVITDMRYGDEFWYITSKPWTDRFWNWWNENFLAPYKRNDNHSVIEGNMIAVTSFNQFFYEVRSKEIDVPLMLIEAAQFDAPPKCYVLRPINIRTTWHLKLHQRWVMMARSEPTIMPFETVSYTKMRQLATAGGTAFWVRNKMQGMYDGEES